MSVRKAQVASSFGAVSEDYAAVAGFQRLVAERLARRIGGLPSKPNVLEVGCGAGFLTQALRQGDSNGQWVVSDIAPSMVRSCRRQLGDPAGVHFMAMDAEQPAVLGGFDLICSNLVFQWLDNLEDCLHQLAALLAPGGRLAFSTLAAGSLDEWHQVHLSLDLPSPTPEYPDAKTLAAMLDGVALHEEDIVQGYPSAHAFAANLKAIGAHTPAPGRRPLPAGALRRALRKLDDQDGVFITYRVAYGLYTRGSE